MVDFPTIQTRVNRRVIDLPTAVVAEVPDLVNKAIRKAGERHNFRIMEAESAMTTVVETRKLGDIPSDWKEKRGRPYLRQGQDGVLGTVLFHWSADKEDMIKRYNLDDPVDSGEPRFILLAEAGTELWVFPFPGGESNWTDGEHRVVMPYYKFLAALTGSETNWFTDNMEDYVVFWAVGQAFMMNWAPEQAAQLFTLASREFDIGKRMDKMSMIEKDISIAVKMDAGGVAPRRT